MPGSSYRVVAMTALLSLLSGLMTASLAQLPDEKSRNDEPSRQALTSSSVRPTRTWVADLAHSSIEFRTSHWGIIDIIGWFEEFQITVYSDRDDFSDAVIEAQVNPASVRMPNSRMADNLLAHMFDVEDFPKATFRSTRVTLVEENKYEVTGILTMNGVENEITWSGTLNGFGNPPNALPGFTLRTELDRRVFNVGDELADEEVAGQPPTVGHTVVVICNMRLDYAN